MREKKGEGERRIVGKREEVGREIDEEGGDTVLSFAWGGENRSRKNSEHENGDEHSL